MSRANRMKLKEFHIMNYVPRTSLRRALESNIGRNKEIEYEKYKEMKEGHILFVLYLRSILAITALQPP